MSCHRELYDNVKNTVAKLHVLRDSCTGIINTEKSSQKLTWFQGAATMLQEAVDELQKALRALEVDISIAKNEAKDWTHVERLIKKLDKFYDTQIPVALEDQGRPENRDQRAEDREQHVDFGFRIADCEFFERKESEVGDQRARVRSKGDVHKPLTDP
jgi:hypothetical protein